MTLLRSTILASSVFTLFAIHLHAGVPDEPKPEKPPIIEKPTPELRAKAEAATQKSLVEVMASLKDRKNFGRSIPFTYSLELATTAPEGVAEAAERVPFALFGELPFNIKPKPRVTILAGYYDAKADAVQLYDEKKNQYVAAADHPRVIEAKAKK